MNKTSYRRLCALLAAADISRSDIWELAHAVQKRGPEGVCQDVADMRKELLLRPDKRGSLPGSDLPGADEFVEKVRRLLFDEARLTKTEAFDVFWSEIRSRYPEIHIAPDKKKGFTAWIQKLSTVVPESDLLHLATTIRNSFVHQSQQDWGLK